MEETCSLRSHGREEEQGQYAHSIGSELNNPSISKSFA